MLFGDFPQSDGRAKDPLHILKIENIGEGVGGKVVFIFPLPNHCKGQQPCGVCTCGGPTHYSI